MEKFSRYLPSKKFLHLAGISLAVLLGVFGFIFLVSATEIFSPNNKKESKLQVGNQTFLEMVNRDTDGDGIPDWEEDLWGTDKNKKITFENTLDATYIGNKKKALNIEGSTNTKGLTETEKFAREFFTSYSAMKSSGEVDDEAIQAFSGLLGDTIIDPNLVNIYTAKNLRLNDSESVASKKKYYQNLQNLYGKYLSLGIGDELEILSGEIATGGEGAGQLGKLTTISNAYKDYAKGIMALEVPTSLSSYHLNIANSANNTGVSVLNMNKVINDPIVGLSGLSQYQKYSEELIKAVADLENALSV